MVYHGKPSQGCNNCRARKIKCDRARPACLQCTRTSRECGGYRDEWVLFLKDETHTTANRVHSSRSRCRSHLSAFPAGSRTDTDTAPRCTVPGRHAHAENPLQLQLPRTLTPCTSNQEAISFFLQAHYIPGSFSFTDTLTTFLTEPGASPGRQAIQATIYAVSSAMLARVRRTESLNHAARREYGSALRLLNVALADGAEAKTNQTLGAVVFLALYEIVVSRRPQGIQGWTNHIRGAAALFEHRGIPQLQNELGTRLFQHLRYQIIVSCLQRDMHVPPSLMQADIHAEVQNTIDTRLILIIGNLSNLRADIKLKNITDPQYIIEAAYAIDAELTAWHAALPPGYAYTTHTLSSLNWSFTRRCHGLSPYGNQYHVYPDMWAPNCWNRYRCARILVCEIVVGQLRTCKNLPCPLQSTPLSPNINIVQSQLQALHATATHLATEICLSVPFHFGIGHSSELKRSSSSGSYISGLMLLWPLFIAGIVARPDSGQRKWVMRALKIVGYAYGLAQALALRDLLAFDRGIIWEEELLRGVGVGVGAVMGVDGVDGVVEGTGPGTATGIQFARGPGGLGGSDELQRLGVDRWVVS